MTPDRNPWDDDAIAELEEFSLDNAPAEIAAGFAVDEHWREAPQPRGDEPAPTKAPAATLAPPGEGDRTPMVDPPPNDELSIDALRHVLLMGGALVVWLWAVASVDEAALGDLGLVGVLPVAGLVAVVALIVGFTVAVTQDRTGRVPGIYVLAITVALHGAPTLAYEHLRFSWAWKHVGIVEFIQRTGGVDPGIETHAVYHNWPGFFGVNAWITTSSQLESALSYAAWAPIAFNLLFVAALYVLLKSFTNDQRLIWTGLLFFVLGNWVGQDYFAPQALAFFFYLAVLALLLRWFGTKPAVLESVGSGTLTHRILVISVVVGLLAMVITHQLTPVMMIIALGALLAARAIDVRWPLYTAVLLLVAWIIGPAWDFVVDNSQTVVRDIGGFQANIEGGITDLGGVDQGQATVAFVARSMTAGMVALAALGWVSRRTMKLPTSVAVLLAVAPIALILFSSYGDEIVFRVYLFALPFLAWLAASVWFPAEDTAATDAARITLGIVAVTMAGALLIANFGSDIRHVFSDTEVAVADFVYANSVPGSLLVEVNRDYPAQFQNYENFTYITVDRTSDETRGRVLDDPAGVLGRWLADGQFSDGYVLITETMRQSVDRLGTMPQGAADTIEEALRSSTEFVVVFEAGESVAFALRSDP